MLMRNDYVATHVTLNLIYATPRAYMYFGATCYNVLVRTYFFSSLAPILPLQMRRNSRGGRLSVLQSLNLHR